MNFHVVTIFPQMIEAALQQGLVAQAAKEGRIKIATLSPREFTTNLHQSVDDRPFGGGAGMLMLAEPLALAVEDIQRRLPQPGSAKVIALSPRGRLFTDRVARELADDGRDLILISGRYEGIDQRFLNTLVDEELSIGDYVLSGGELAALVVIDAISRLVHGVVGNETSPEKESFSRGGGLEYPQFTRPREWRGQTVPEPLLSGHHARLETWKTALSALVTAERRPEFLETFSDAELKESLKVLAALNDADRIYCGLGDASKIVDKIQTHLASRR